MIELVGILLLSVGEGNSTKIADEWRSAAHEFVKQCEMSENLLGSHAPQDSNRIRQMLLGDTPAHVTWHIEENGRRKLVMDIYFQVGELHIINHVDGLNLVTNVGCLKNLYHLL